MTPATLFLFDLDGTLVSTGGAGMRALERTFFDLHRVEKAHDKVNPAGKTDPAIFREIYRASFGRDASPAEIAAITERYLSHLSDQMKTAKTKSFNGVEQFVQAVSQRGDIAMGLGTGNLEKGARLKLAPTNFNNYFAFGGFGSDSEDRAELLKHGHRRAEERVGGKISPDRVFIIGDTPLDVTAARRAGYKVVAVATGRTTYNELAATSPDFVWHDMTEGHEFLEEIK